MGCVLGIGVATLDIINEVDGYPTEDSEVRAIDQRRSCGGNAVNTLSVLRLLGHHCVFGGVLPNDFNGELIRMDLEHRGIGLDASRVHEEGKTPTSCICLNRRNGSRTIVHYRDLPEYRYEDFSRINLSVFDWLHFEGRYVDDTRTMFERVRNQRPSLPISVDPRHRSGMRLGLCRCASDWARWKRVLQSSICAPKSGGYTRRRRCLQCGAY